MCSQFGLVQLRRQGGHSGQAAEYKRQRLQEQRGHWARKEQAAEWQQHGAASGVELKELVAEQCRHHRDKARAKYQMVVEPMGQDLEVMELDERRLQHCAMLRVQQHQLEL